MMCNATIHLWRNLSMNALDREGGGRVRECYQQLSYFNKITKSGWGVLPEYLNHVLNIQFVE